MSYYAEYVKHRSIRPSLSHFPATKLLSDSGEYINFLETQLERVTAALLEVQNYGIRLKDLENSFEGFSETVDITKTLSEVKGSPVYTKIIRYTSRSSFYHSFVTLLYINTID